MNTAELSSVCKQVRRDIITMIANAGSGHPGGSLSMVELMTSVFYNHMRIDPKDPKNPDRDRFVLSKGPATMQCWRSWASSAATNLPTSASCTASCRAIPTAKRYPA